jgi:competence protein ComFC
MTPARIKPFLDASLGLIYPENCQICLHQPATAADGFVCPECWQKVRFIRPPFCKRCGLPYVGEITNDFECTNCRDMKLYFVSARSAVAAGELILEVIHRYKYSRALWFEPFLADLLVREAAPELAKNKWDMLVPVPLHPAKQREREFNQAERLGRHLARATRIPLNTKLLRRVQSTQTQTLLSREQRAANVNKAFAMRSDDRLDGLRVVLLDDVFTTGATTSSCAKVLLSAGAESVCVWTVARGL